MTNAPRDSSLHLLIVTASDERAAALATRVEHGGAPAQWTRVTAPAALRSALRQRGGDAIIHVHGETGLTAVAALKVAHHLNLDIPCLIVAEPGEEKAAIRAMKSGAHDVVANDRLDRLLPALEREIREARRRAEHRAALDMMHDSEARFRALASSLPGMVFQLYRDAGGDFRFLFVSEGCHRLLGIKQHELLSSPRRFFDAFDSADRQLLEAAFELSAQSGLSVDWEGRLKGRARGKWIDIRSTPQRNDENGVAWQGIATDITEGKGIEAELRRSREQLSELSFHLEAVREEERERIARDIHDEIGSLLLAIKIETKLLTAKLPEPSAGLSEKAHGIETLIDQAMGTASRVARELRPGILKEFGLAEAIRCQSDDFAKRFSITCRVQCDDKDGAIEPDADTSLALFRIVQEALTNIAKHAHASLVVVRLRRENGSISVEIRDNGRGISDDDMNKPKSFGLRGIRERVHSLSGSFSVSASEGGGTYIALRVPERRDAEPAGQEEDLQRNLF